MRRTVCLTVAGFLGILGCAAPSAAQDVPYGEIAVGYNFMRYQQLDFGANLKTGLFGEAAINLNHAVGLIGLLTTSQSADDVRVSTFMGGLRLSRRGFGRGPGRTIPFFQILGGLVGTKIGDDNFIDRAIEVGGGVNVTVTNQAGVRVEADFLHTFYRDQATLGDNYVRVSVGFMYGFGSH